MFRGLCQCIKSYQRPTDLISRWCSWQSSTPDKSIHLCTPYSPQHPPARCLQMHTKEDAMVSLHDWTRKSNILSKPSQHVAQSHGRCETFSPSTRLQRVQQVVPLSSSLAHAFEMEYPCGSGKKEKKEAKSMKILEKEQLLCASTVFKRDNSGNINILGNVEYRFSRGAWGEMNMWVS